MKIFITSLTTKNVQLSALLLIVGLIASVVSILIVSVPAKAANKNDWVTTNIISDVNFTNKNSMSESEIQAFLNKQIGSCDIYGTGKAAEYGSSLTRAQYAKSRGWAGPPYVCLNKYYEVPKISPGSGTPKNNWNKDLTRPTGSKSAAWIIKDAANRYNISPKVLLVKIATESSGPLTSDKWPLYSQYRYAMGSHCPDSGPGGTANCDSNYAGFSIQMYSAAQLMRSYLDNMDQPWWTLKRPGKGINGSNYVGWNVEESGCGGTNLNIANKATAALYTYTPYQPNKAALENLYGTGDRCSAYGNRNFWRVYTDWFGSTRYRVKGSIADYYNTGNISTTLGDAVENESQTANGGYKQCFEKGCIVGSGPTKYWIVSGSIGRYYWDHKGPSSSHGLPIGEMVKINDSFYQQPFQNGLIIGKYDTGYWGVSGSIGAFYDSNDNSSYLGIPTESMKKSGEGYKQCFEKGCIVGSGATKYWIVRGSIGKQYWDEAGPTGRMGLPLGEEINADNGIFYQKYQRGYIAGKYTTGYWSVKGSIGAAYDPTKINTLGIPLAKEEEADDSGIWQQRFSGGYIVGSSKSGYWSSLGAIRDYWINLNQWKGKMGIVTGPIAVGELNMTYQTYQNGVIVINPATGKAWESKGSIRKVWEKYGTQTGQLGFPTGPEVKSVDGIWSQTFDHGKIETKNGNELRVTFTP